MKGKLLFVAFVALASSAIHLWQRTEVKGLLKEIEERRKELSQVKQQGSRIRYELAHLTSLPEIERRIREWNLDLEFPGVGDVVNCPDPVPQAGPANRDLRGFVDNVVEKGKSLIFSRETLEAGVLHQDSLW